MKAMQAGPVPFYPTREGGGEEYTDIGKKGFTKSLPKG